MMADVISGVVQMQQEQSLKNYTTKELLDELISLEEVKLRQEGDISLLDVTN